jgi:predicted transposase/invertase (TIGR01784 family)
VLHFGLILRGDYSAIVLCNPVDDVLASVWLRLNQTLTPCKFVKTDSIFYQLFKIYPDSFFQLIDREPQVRQGNYKFSSVEVKALSRRIDGIFLPQKRDGLRPTGGHRACPIYFTEVQFQPDPLIYWRFVTESFLYLGQYQPKRHWQSVLIFARKSLDPGVPPEYQFLLDTQQLRVFYLKELVPDDAPELGIEILKLILEPQKTAIPKAKQVIQQAEQEVNDASLKRDVIGLIQDVIVYKFPKRPRSEIEAMFGLEELRKTRYYQDVAAEAKVEGKLETIPNLAAIGLTPEQIAQALNLDLAVVKQVLAA